MNKNYTSTHWQNPFRETLKLPPSKLWEDNSHSVEYRMQLSLRIDAFLFTVIKHVEPKLLSMYEKIPNMNWFIIAKLLLNSTSDKVIFSLIKYDIDRTSLLVE